ncbi:MAG: RnfABCDGE type electron transport complex subunit B [Planctomycetota bacterium]
MSLGTGIVIAALLVMAVLAIVFGVGLAFAETKFYVEVDARVMKVLEALPGVNCGACGYPGCEGYAQAVVKGEKPNLCVPGGQSAALAAAHIMGQKLEEERLPVRAVVHCQGGTEFCGQRFEYYGIEECGAAHMVQGGSKACAYGCLGYGTCAKACPFGAITMGEERIPRVDWETCTGCGTCVRTCPRNLIETMPITTRIALACSSQDRGKDVRAVCKTGCIACWLCVKKSPEGSVEKKGNLPKLLYPKGADYQEAAEACPMGCFVQFTETGEAMRVVTAEARA